MANDTADRILDAARDLFLEDGASAVTMRAVAARAGITAMAIYRHFKNRDDLLRAIVAKGQNLFLQYLQMSLAERTALGRLTRSGEEYLRFALENPRDYAIIFMEPVDEAAEGLELRAWQDTATFRFLVDRIRECADEGLLDAPDPEEAALTIWAQVHGLVSLYLANKLHLTEREFRAVYTRSMAHVARAFAPGQHAKPRRRERA